MELDITDQRSSSIATSVFVLLNTELLQLEPYLKRLVAGFLSRRPGFEPGSDQVGFVMDKVALG
jgi:hypothetical protein